MFSRKLAASAMALTLATGLVACSNDDNAADSTTEVETATETNTATETVAEETVTESATSSAATSATAADAEATEELTLADGTTAMVPAGVIEASEKYADSTWGEPMAVEEIDNGWIVTYDNDHYITWNENTGGAPTWGQIANEWLTDVRLDKKLGFPVAPETENADKSGWTQEFEKGTIEWTRGGTEDAFTAIITPKN